MENKKIGLYFMALALAASVSFTISSCNSDEYNLTSENLNMNIKKINLVQESLERVCRDDLIDSVAESDVFLDFMIETKVVMNKFQLYTKTLAEAELTEFKYNINNDDYLEKFINLAGISNEMEKLLIEKNNLLSNAQFNKLNDLEKEKLLIHFIDGPNLMTLKNGRESILYSKCWEAYQADLNHAEMKATTGILACSCLIVSGPGASACVLAVLDKLDDDKRAAKRDFEECQEREGGKQ